MATGTYVIVSIDDLNKFSEQIMELKQIMTLLLNHSPGISSPQEPLDSADVMDILKISRRTLYKYRKNGLPSVRKANGKIYYWRRDIDEFLKTNGSC